VLLSEGCILFLTDRKIFLTLYRVVSVAAAFYGAIASVQIIWDIADIFNGLMILPNMFLLFLKRNEIVKRG
jgi:AGCS family alanine or glycine:cation symporter